VYVARHRHLHFDLLCLDFQNMAPDGSIGVDEVQMLACYTKSLPIFRRPTVLRAIVRACFTRRSLGHFYLQSNNRALNIVIHLDGLLFSQLMQRLAFIHLPPHRPAFDVLKVAIDPVRHEKILGMTIVAVQRPIDVVLVLQPQFSDVLSDESSAHGKRDLVVDVRLSHIAFGLQLVDFAIQKQELAVHAYKRPQALITHLGEFGDGDFEGR